MSVDIESPQNPQIKHLVKLRHNRERKSSGETRIDGGRELVRALQAGVRPEAVYHCPPRVRGEDAADALALAGELGVVLRSVSEAVYEKLRFGDRDEGLCANLRWTARSPAELRTSRPRGLVLIVESVEKPGNLGALLRTADGVGVDAVVCVDPACDVSGPNVIRASMGAIFGLAVFSVDFGTCRDWLAEIAMHCVLTGPQAPRPYWEVDYRGPTAIVMGAEHSGLRPHWDGIQADAVHLPMNGVSDSLNLSVATAVVLYEALRQRSV